MAASSSNSIHSPEDQAKLDAALDAALDEFSDSDDEDDDGDDDNDKGQQLAEPSPPGSKGAEPSLPFRVPVVMGPSLPPQNEADLMSRPEEVLFSDMMQSLLTAAQAETASGGTTSSSVGANGQESFLFDQMMQQMMQAATEDSGAATWSSGAENASSGSQQQQQQPATPPSKTKKKKNKEQQQQQQQQQPSGGDPVEAAIRNLVDNMAQQARNLEDVDNDDDIDELPNVPNMDELSHLMENLLGGDNSDANADAVLNGMMEQLLSKELMYEPMKQVAERFPQWLREHQNDADYAQRLLQSQCFQQLVHVYETEPHNGAKLMDLMTEAQEFGQPPGEIVQAIAPGMELDADGMPKGFPLGNGNEDCCVM